MPRRGEPNLRSEPVLFEAVLLDVVGEANHCAVADFEIVGSDGDAARAQFLNLPRKVVHVNDHTVAHHVDLVLAQNAGRQKVEHEFSSFVDDGVPGVVAALITHYDVLLFGKQVHHTSLSFVAPVDSHYRSKHIAPRKNFIPLSKRSVRLCGRAQHYTSACAFARRRVTP